MGYIRDRWRDPARAGKGKRWQVKYRVDGREVDGGTFDVKALAKRHLTEVEGRLQRGEWIDLTDQTTVADAARAYAQTRPYGPATAQRVDGYIRNHLAPTTLGAARLVAVKPSTVQTWATERARVMAPTTLRALVKFVRSVFTAAVADGTIVRTPFVRISLPPHSQERVVPLTVAQVRALADEVRPQDRYRAMVITQAGLGLRIGELLGLRVRDVDFLGRSVRIEDQIDKRTRERVPPKTPRSRRTLPLPETVSIALAEHLRKTPAAPNGLLFHTADGLPFWHEYYTQKVFKPAVERAELPAGTTSHDLRHHYASVLLAAGESVVGVAERLGHESAALVVEVYGHLLPDSEVRTRRAIDDAWAALEGDAAESGAAQGLPR